MNPITKLRRQVRRGFSIADLLVALVLVGIISGIGYPYYVNVTEATNQAAAVSKAQTLNSAQASFKASDPSYAADWAAAVGNQAKYTLLRSFIPGSPTNLTDYEVTGYTFTFNASDINGSVTITGPSGVVSY